MTLPPDRTAAETVLDLQDAARALLAGLTALRIDLDLACEEHSQAQRERTAGQPLLPAAERAAERLLAARARGDCECQTAAVCATHELPDGDGWGMLYQAYMLAVEGEHDSDDHVAAADFAEARWGPP
jgi:hypothetical protein